VAGNLWQEHGLVFASRVGTPLTPIFTKRIGPQSGQSYW
jgi:hypothetical protein